MRVAGGAVPTVREGFTWWPEFMLWVRTVPFQLPSGKWEFHHYQMTTAEYCLYRGIS